MGWGGGESSCNKDGCVCGLGGVETGGWMGGSLTPCQTMVARDQQNQRKS